MRNLKRALSLVMAMALIVGMMVVSASAAGKDFTDADEIDHTEAVEVMVALNVIAGKEDGSYYDPTGSLTRAEMAKVISYVMNGGVEPVVGTKVTPTYSDIKGHWAEKYIEYCTSMGIINGDGAGKFNPEGTLTGEQAAKMFLTAMGYNANVFGFTGNDWAINVGRYANEAGLYKNLGDVTPSAVITRDDAAQMAYNAIQATMMRRTWSQDLQTGELTETYAPWTVEISGGVSVGWTLLNDKFDGAIAYTYLEDFTYDEVKGLWTYYFDEGANFGGNAIPTNKAYSGGALTSGDDYTDLFGQQVKVIYNAEDSDMIYGIYASDSSVVATGASGELGDIDDTARTIKVGDASYRLDSASASIPVYNTGVNANVDTLANLKANQLANAFTFKLVDNTGDGKIDAVIRTPITVSQIIYVGTNTISFSNLAQRDKELVVIYDGYAQGDWVYYTAAANSATGIDTFEKAELKTATVDAVKGSDVATGYSDFQLNGAWVSETTNGSYSVATAEVNDTIEYVTLGTVMFYAKVTDVAATTKNVAMVITADDVDGEGSSGLLGGGTVKAKLLFADGSKATQVIAKLDGAEVTAASQLNSTIGALVTYRTNSDGDYELTTVATSGTTGNLAGYKGASATGAYDDEEVAGYELADDAVVFVLKGTKGTAAGTNDGKVYTGKEIKNAYADGAFGSTGQILYGMESGFNYAKVACLTNAAFPVITAGSNYGYITSGAYRTVESDKTYLNLTYWTADGEEKAKFESLDAPADYPAGAIITYDTVSDTEIKNVSIVNAATGIVTGWDGVKKIEIQPVGDSKFISEVDSVDTVVIYVNSKDKKGAEGGSIQIGKDTDNNDEADVANVRYVAGGAYLSLLVVDVNNEMEAGPAITLGAGADTSDIAAALSSSDSVTISGAVASGTTINVPTGKTVNVTATQTNALNVTLASGATLNVSDGLSFADNSTITAGSGSTVKFGTRDVVGGNGLTSTGNITVKTLTGGKLQYTLTANAVLNGGTLEIAGADELAGSFKITGTNGAVIKVYSSATLGTNAWTYDEVASTTATSTTPNQNFAANNTYTWTVTTGDPSVSGWLKTSGT